MIFRESELKNSIKLIFDCGSLLEAKLYFDEKNNKLKIIIKNRYYCSNDEINHGANIKLTGREQYDSTGNNRRGIPIIIYNSEEEYEKDKKENLRKIKSEDKKPVSNFINHNRDLLLEYWDLRAEDLRSKEIEDLLEYRIKKYNYYKKKVEE